MKKISWLIGLFLLLSSCQTTHICDERVSFLKRHDAMIYQYQKTNPYLCEASFDGLFHDDQIKNHAFVFIAVDGAVVSITQTLQHQLNTFLQQSSQNTAILYGNSSSGLSIQVETNIPYGAFDDHQMELIDGNPSKTYASHIIEICFLLVRNYAEEL